VILAILDNSYASRKLVNILEKPTISQDEYAVALFLLHRNLIGIAIPKSLPSILIPPLIRSHPLFRCPSVIEAWDPKLDAPTSWDISGSIWANASRIFSFLDLKSRGFIKRDAVISLMKESKLPVHDLAQIWCVLNINLQESFKCLIGLQENHKLREEESHYFTSSRCRTILSALEACWHGFTKYLPRCAQELHTTTAVPWCILFCTRA